MDATASPISDGSVIDTEAKALQRVHEHAPAHHLTLAAPTGKAANRLTQLTGKRASTIHASLYQQVSPTRIALDETLMLDPLLFRELMDKICQHLFISPISSTGYTLTVESFPSGPTALVPLGDPD